MNEYLDTLKKALSRLGQEEREDILQDYREHFQIGLAKGKTEAQIATELGDPQGIAKMYTALTLSEQAGKTTKLSDAFRMVGAVLAYKLGGGLLIGTLYLSFILCMIPIFALGVGLLAGVLGAMYVMVAEFFRGYILYGILAGFLSVFLLGMGMLSLIGSSKLWKMIIKVLSGFAPRVLKNGAGEAEEA